MVKNLKKEKFWIILRHNFNCMIFTISLQNLFFLTGISAALYSISKLNFKEILSFVINVVIYAFVFATAMSYTSSVIVAIIAVIITNKLLTADIDFVSFFRKSAYAAILFSFWTYLFFFLNI